LTVYQLQHQMRSIIAKKQVDAVLSWDHDAALYPWDFGLKKRCLRHDRRTFILFNMDEPANWAETGEA